ncbi:MAG: hypothetical protein P8Z75_06125 [Gammaproteobacteria bacterium]|jgi:hypothetical protein
MATDMQITQRGQSWYVTTPNGLIGPLGSEQEAADYVRLLQLALAAGSEIACTEEECLL